MSHLVVLYFPPLFKFTVLIPNHSLNGDSLKLPSLPSQAQGCEVKTVSEMKGSDMKRLIQQSPFILAC